MLTRLFVFVVLIVSCSTSYSIAQERVIAADAAATKPLKVGQKLPDATLKNTEGQAVTLASINKNQPLVIVFFRGSWCPFCTRHTGELIKAYPQLKDLGYELIGISPDSIDASKANVSKNSIPFPIYSDSDISAASAFGLAFKVDDATLTKYKGFGIDLEKTSGHSHHALPVPAVYIVDKDGVITFAHSDVDYKKRLDTKDLLKAVSK